MPETISYRRPVAQKKGGGFPVSAPYPEAASQSFSYMDPVKLSSGKVAIAASNDTDILGFALRAATETEDSVIPVALAVPQNEFLLNVYHSTEASAITAVTMVGSCYALIMSSGNPYIDIEDSTNKVLQIDRLLKEDAVGSIYGRVWCSVPDQYSQVRDDDDDS